MRVAVLELLAFGPFKGLTLDFSVPRDGLHVVYGKNEAGKSTALRAVTGLLYGIPTRTSDAHAHAPQDLRIGAHLEGHRESLRIVRRKGLRNTLLDPAGRPIDDAALRRLLGGIGEELFRTMFGLDHDALRRGAQALLEGRGDVGETLLGAAVGGTGLHQIRKQLKDEADGLFTPLAHKKPLNEALRVFADAQKQSRYGPTSAETWEAQKRAVEESILESERLEREARQLREQRHRLQRAARALPMLVQQRELAARRAALGDVVMLPPTATTERVASQREAAQARLQEERLRREITQLQAERAALVVPEELATVTEAVDELPSRLGSYRKAQHDLPRVQGEAELLELAVSGILRRLGQPPDTPLEELEKLRVDTAAQAKIRKLASEPAVIQQRLTQAQTDLVLRKAKESAEWKKLYELEVPDVLMDVTDALARAQREGELEDRIGSAEANLARLESAAAVQHASLGLTRLSLDDAAALPVPSPEAVERFDQRASHLVKSEDLLAERERALAAKLAEIDRDVDELERAGSVPTEADLEGARALRDGTWRALRLRGEPVNPQAADAFEERVRDADELADRLRREAARVTSMARLLADRSAADVERARLEKERTALADLFEEVASSWRAAWAPAGIDPEPPADMRPWLVRHAALVAQMELVREARRELGVLSERADELIAALKMALAAEARDAGSLSGLVAAAQRSVLTSQGAARKREELERVLDELAEDVVRLSQEAALHERAHATWRSAWAASVGALGLGPDATPEEAGAVLAELGELFPKLEELSRVRRRIRGIERDAAQFAEDVGALVVRHAPDLATLPPEQSAAELTRRTHQARTDRATLGQLERQIEDKRRTREEQEMIRAVAETRLAELVRAAGVGDVDALVQAERRSAEAETIDAELRDLERSLVGIAEGVTLAALAEETSGLDADGIAAELERLDAQIEETDHGHAIEQRSIGEKAAGLRDMETKSIAADSAAQAQEALAKVRTHVERYVRLRLAGAILSREIERYRQENQGPILGRASELFQRLTLGSFTALRAGWDDADEAVIRCVRPDGKELGMDALSDGARDQLYLALRLASLERFTEGNEPMPLVVDDVLIHFDDDRARAALSALADLASRTQILFFTHHARLVELAREAVPVDRLREHRLG